MGLLGYHGPNQKSCPVNSTDKAHVQCEYALHNTHTQGLKTWLFKRKSPFQWVLLGLFVFLGFLMPAFSSLLTL